MKEMQEKNAEIVDLDDFDVIEKNTETLPAEKAGVNARVVPQETSVVKVEKKDNLEYLGFLVTLGCAHIFTAGGKLKAKDSSGRAKNIPCSRNQIAEILYNIANTTQKIGKIVENAGVSKSAFLNARYTNKSLATAYRNVKIMRSEILFDSALEVAMRKIDDEKDYETTKYGKRFDSGAEIQRQNSFKNRLQLASIYERGVINEKKEDKMQVLIQQKNLTVNIADFMSMPVQDFAKLAFSND